MSALLVDISRIAGFSTQYNLKKLEEIMEKGRQNYHHLLVRIFIRELVDFMKVQWSRWLNFSYIKFTIFYKSVVSQLDMMRRYTFATAKQPKSTCIR